MNKIDPSSGFLEYPGGDLVQSGLKDLGAGIHSEAALLVSIASPRLEGLGFRVPELKGVPEPYEHALFEMIEGRMASGAHAEYNALIGRMVSFANSYRR